jgi:predicted Rdx family selenoprotein
MLPGAETFIFKLSLVSFDRSRAGFFAIQKAHSNKGIKAWQRKKAGGWAESEILQKKFACYVQDHNCCVCKKWAENSKTTEMRNGVPQLTVYT